MVVVVVVDVVVVVANFAVAVEFGYRLCCVVGRRNAADEHFHHLMVHSEAEAEVEAGVA